MCCSMQPAHWPSGSELSKTQSYIKRILKNRSLTEHYEMGYKKKERQDHKEASLKRDKYVYADKMASADEMTSGGGGGGRGR